MGASSMIILILAALAFATIAILVSKIVTKTTSNKAKLEPYECGIPTTGKTWTQLNVGYYLFALIFLIFDVELVFLYPWAVILRELSGLDFLTGILAGRLPAPPVARLLGFAFTEVEAGRVVMALDPAEFHYNPLSTVHGGIAATLLDSVMACAIHSTLPAGRGYTTLEIKINYVRAITAATGRLTAEGKIIHVGRQVATAEGRLVDAEGRLYVHGTTTCIILGAPEAPRGAA